MPSSRLLTFYARLVFVCLILAVTAADAAVPIPQPPAIKARAYVLIDFQTGRVLAQDKGDVQMEPASITKLMTGYAVFRAIKEKRLSPTDSVTISEHAWKAEGSRTFAQVGTQIPVDVLIKGMIVQSGNDATIALAEKVGGTEDGFVQMMNHYAEELGLKNSHFNDSSGLPGPTHYMSAHDIATLSRVIIRDFPEDYKLYSLREFSYGGIKQQNRNGLLARDPTVDGIKTGHTETAGYCLASSAKRGNTRLISVVLGTDSFKAREDASAALLNFGFTFYETVKAKGKDEVVLKPEVYKGETDRVTLVPANDVYVTVGRGAGAQLKTTATVKEPVIAPIKAGQALGELVVSDGKDVVARVPLVAQVAVPEGGWWTRMVDGISLWMK
ncbi:MAG TPA: D-alanyl-D-alanine carboxypeptidase family protein [Steroidobacteraceae bacterium]|nr:D-alanyl-D-alanine carboxypeptidase family protein [Steroidobacteraceae bacterium]